MSEYILMQGEFLLRVVLAAFCGAAIGYERKSRGKGAGIRTHLIVALASALMMVVSKYGFSDAAKIAFGEADFRHDPSRIASQIVTGVGFLGAGMIYFNRKAVRGLTTAAGVWATCGIGMALGSGMYFMGISTAVLIIAFQMLLHRNFKILYVPNEEHCIFTIEDSAEAIDALQKLLGEYDIHIEEMEFKRIENSLINIEMSVTTNSVFNPKELLQLAADNKFIKSVNI